MKHNSLGLFAANTHLWQRASDAAQRSCDSMSKPARPSTVLQKRLS